MALGTVVVGSLLGGAAFGGLLYAIDPLKTRTVVTTGPKRLARDEQPWMKVDPWIEIRAMQDMFAQQSGIPVEPPVAEGSGTTPGGLPYVWRVDMPRPMPGQQIVIGTVIVMYWKDGDWHSWAPEFAMKMTGPNQVRDYYFASARDPETGQAKVEEWVATN